MREGIRGLYRVRLGLALSRYQHPVNGVGGRTWLIREQGISAPIAGAALENASLFMVYGKCQDLIIHLRPQATLDDLSGSLGDGKGVLSIGELAMAGAGAGAVTSFVLYVVLCPDLNSGVVSRARVHWRE